MSSTCYSADAAYSDPQQMSHNTPTWPSHSHAQDVAVQSSISSAVEQDKGAQQKGSAFVGGAMVHVQGQPVPTLKKQQSFGPHLPVHGNEPIMHSDDGRRRSKVALDSRVEVLPDGTVTINPRGDADPASDGEEAGLSDYEGIAEQARIKQRTLKSIRRTIRSVRQ
jgi:hypothetical protein